MMPFTKTFPAFRLYYGWYVVVSTFSIMFFIAGARYSFGVMFIPMIQEFGWNRASISLAFFLNMTFFALSLIVLGRFCDRFGARRVILISTVFLGVGYAFISIIHALWQFYFFYGILAGIGLGGVNIPLIAVLMSKWFQKRRSFMISLVLAGGCLGQFALVPFFTTFTQRYGWRASYLCIGLVMFLVNMTVALLVLKREPGDELQAPFRAGKAEEQKKKGNPVASGKEVRDMGLKEAMHTLPFWLFAIAMFVCGSGDFLVTTHLIPFVTDHGLSSTTAGNMLAWFGLMSLAGILIAGPTSDRIGNRIPLVAAFGLRFLSYLLILKYQNQFSFYLFALTFGFTYLITANLTTTVIGNLYGFSHIGFISGFISTVHHFGGGFWAYMGGLIFDHTGNYQLIFIMSAVMALIALMSCMLISEKRIVAPLDKI